MLLPSLSVIWEHVRQFLIRALLLSVALHVLVYLVERAAQARERHCLAERINATIDGARLYRGDEPLSTKLWQAEVIAQIEIVQSRRGPTLCMRADVSWWKYLVRSRESPIAPPILYLADQVYAGKYWHAWQPRYSCATHYALEQDPYVEVPLKFVGAIGNLRLFCPSEHPAS